MSRRWGLHGSTRWYLLALTRASATHRHPFGCSCKSALTWNAAAKAIRRLTWKENHDIPNLGPRSIFLCQFWQHFLISFISRKFTDLTQLSGISISTILTKSCETHAAQNKPRRKITYFSKHAHKFCTKSESYSLGLRIFSKELTLILQSLSLKRCARVQIL